MAFFSGEEQMPRRRIWCGLFCLLLIAGLSTNPVFTRGQCGFGQ
jgi:hypothetical protein